MTLTDRQVLHTSRMGKLISYAFENGLAIKVLEWNRLLKTQEEYVAKGVSKTLESMHLYNLATDCVLVVSGSAVFADNDSPKEIKDAYRALGEYGESIGLRWGGRFVNRVAFKAKHGREFDPASDLGWDCGHWETAD